MDITERKNIKLLNYCTSSVNVPTEKGDKILNGSNDDTPFADIFSWEQIEYIFNRSSAIQNGLIEPLVKDRQEFYEALRFNNWENRILFDDTLENIVSNPTIGNMERVLAIDSIQVLERLRGKMTGYINQGRGLDSRFINVVKARFEEINRGIRKSEIVLNPNVNYKSVVYDEIEAMKAQNELLMRQMAEMKQMLENQMADKAGNKPSEALPDDGKKATTKPPKSK